MEPSTPLLPSYSSANNPKTDLYILVCVPNSPAFSDLSRNTFFQINATSPLTDAEFWTKFRSEYKRLRGWRHYFSIHSFVHCKFSQFKRLGDRHHYIHERDDVPEASNTEYHFEDLVPGAAQQEPDNKLDKWHTYTTRFEPIISIEEWQRRFYETIPASKRDFLSLLPKRDHPFNLANQEEDQLVWGLTVEYDHCGSLLGLFGYFILGSFTISALLFALIWTIDFLASDSTPSPAGHP